MGYTSPKSQTEAELSCNLVIWHFLYPEYDPEPFSTFQSPFFWTCTHWQFVGVLCFLFPCGLIVSTILGNPCVPSLWAGSSRAPWTKLPPPPHPLELILLRSLQFSFLPRGRRQFSFCRSSWALLQFRPAYPVEQGQTPPSPCEILLLLSPITYPTTLSFLPLHPKFWFFSRLFSMPTQIGLECFFVFFFFPCWSINEHLAWFSVLLWHKPFYLSHSIGLTPCRSLGTGFTCYFLLDLLNPFCNVYCWSRSRNMVALFFFPNFDDTNEIRFHVWTSCYLLRRHCLFPLIRGPFSWFLVADTHSHPEVWLSPSCSDIFVLRRFVFPFPRTVSAPHGVFEISTLEFTSQFVRLLFSVTALRVPCWLFCSPRAPIA